MGKFIGFGDLLVGLNPVGYRRFLQADTMEVNYTGAEANVCVSLARFGIDTEFVTRLPQNDIALCAVAQLRKYGVGTELALSIRKKVPHNDRPKWCMTENTVHFLLQNAANSYGMTSSAVRSGSILRALPLHLAIIQHSSAKRLVLLQSQKV